ncbi:hypothetical protein MKW94_012582 [Papaver nudicaule]|uniref:PPPDE domain-containing protein n=1 Tax=Papaver nudicaule TaxID=74823 RepID=A0AA42B0F4_PAPNU|nr:hypothetical protein [Papaver nudicaule]
MAEEGQKVTLNVYDLSQGLARQLSTTFLGRAIEGIWHTGVVVFGSEYYFGGGIQHSPVGTTPYGKPIKVVDLGVTHVPKEIFEEYLQEISPRYTAETYSLLKHNCNNFSNEVAQFLVGTNIPDYILELPNDVLSSPMGAMILPMIQQLETTLRSGAVPQVPQFRPTSSSQQPSHSIPTPAAAPASLAREVANGSGNPLSSDGKTTTAETPEKKKTNNSGDPLGDARLKVQEEITAEFAAIMASGTLRASEAAALATRRVMERHGLANNAVMPQR